MKKYKKLSQKEAEKRKQTQMFPKKLKKKEKTT